MSNNRLTVNYSDLVKFKIVLAGSSTISMISIAGDSYNITESGYLIIYNGESVTASFNKDHWVSITIEV